jgi:hypothetical protein
MTHGFVIDPSHLLSLGRAVETVRVAAASAAAPDLVRLQQMTRQVAELADNLKAAWLAICRSVVVDDLLDEMQKLHDPLVEAMRNAVNDAVAMRASLDHLRGSEDQIIPLKKQMDASVAAIKELARRFTDPWHTAEDLLAIAVENHQFPEGHLERLRQLARDKPPPQAYYDEDVSDLC